jgi:phosphocarrier protein FPr
MDDARTAAARGADFAGLLRTGFCFSAGRIGGVDEQVAVYRKIAESLDGRSHARTLDVGGDRLPGVRRPLR